MWDENHRLSIVPLQLLPLKERRGAKVRVDVVGPATVFGEQDS